jgi:tetratricopeptide (TPR) repeat protein
MLDKIINYISDNFSKKRSFFAGLLGFLILFAMLDGFIEKFILNTSSRGVGYIIICGMWFLFWLYKRNRFPKNKKGYIGIVICIETENDKQKNRIKNDFAKRIRKLISKKNLKDKINIVLLSNYQAEYAKGILEHYVKNKQDRRAVLEWEKIRKRTRGHFFIYGDIKERQDGDNRYYLDLEALVIHAPVHFPTQRQIVQDFLSVWYKQISFQEKIEFKGFLFAADAIFIAVQYVVGIAALVSGDVALALELHTRLNTDSYFGRFNPLPPNLQRVKQKLKILMAEENFLIAKSFSRQENFTEAEKYIEQSLTIDPNYSAYLLKSIIEFSYKNNPTEALTCVYQAKEMSHSGDGTWRYNEGFLLMYMEKFDDALKVYEKITKTVFLNEGNILLEIYKFNEEFLGKEPGMIQSYFIIGFLKYKKDSNYPDALDNLEKFLSKSEGKDKYRILRERTETYVKELKNLMDL